MSSFRLLSLQLFSVRSLLWSALLVIFAFTGWAGPAASRTGEDKTGTCITYEILLKPSKNEPSQRSMEQLGKWYLDKFVTEAKTTLLRYFASEEIALSQDGALTSSMVFAESNKDPLKDIYAQLTKTYSGKYLPVGKGTLYISLPAPVNEAISVKVSIAGLDSETL